MALARPQVTAKYQRFGSMLSIAPDAIAPVRVPVATPAFGGPPDGPLPPLVPVVVLLDEQAATSSSALRRPAAPNAWGRILIISPPLLDIERVVVDAAVTELIAAEPLGHEVVPAGVEDRGDRRLL